MSLNGRRPRIVVDPASSKPPPRPHSMIGRPLIRWISWSCVAVVVLYIFGPIFKDALFMGGHPDLHPPFPPPPPPHDFDPHHRFPPHFHPPEGHKGRPLPPPLHPHHRPGVDAPDHHHGSSSRWNGRAQKVKEAFVHAYGGYEKHALPADELLPVSGERVNNFCGWSLTLFDSLDTMWIMGLHDTFYRSLETVTKATFFLEKSKFAPFFETVIRYLGGMLGAYALSGETVLLLRADDLGRMLLPAFNTTSGFPKYAVNTVWGNTQMGWSQDVLWSEALSNQMEYKYLAYLTGRAEYYESTEKIMQKMYDAPVVNGSFPTRWSLELGTPTNRQFSVGAFADSAHEYLLKQWLLTGQSEPKIRDLYLTSVNAIISNLLCVTPKRKLLYVTDTESGFPTDQFEHLSCFLPGLLALGAHTLELSAEDREMHMWAAEGLAHTCWITYADQPTGLGPDVMTMESWRNEDRSRSVKGSWPRQVEEWKKEGRKGGVPPGVRDAKGLKGEEKKEYSFRSKSYLLRPETIESLYVMWKVTKDEKWRERGWSIFQSIEKHCRTEYGYASVWDVTQNPAYLKDEQPSWFLAETLKYLYLLFTDADVLPLNEWILNTEAHPFPVFDWRPWEKERYNITT